MNSRQFFAPSGLVLALMLAGCNFAPEYQTPPLSVPTQLKPALPMNGPGALGSADGAAISAWDEAAMAPQLAWESWVQDERLRGVLTLALQGNRNLQQALLNVERARAVYGITRASELPTVGLSGQGSRARSSAGINSSGQASTQNQFSVQLGITAFELDFWGRVRNLSEAGLQSYLASEDTQQSVRLSLLGDTIQAWLNLDADQRRLQLAQDTLVAREHAFALTRRMHELGATSGLVLAQNQTTVDTARLDVAQYQAQVAKDRHALDLLVGSPVPAELLPPMPPATVRLAGASLSATTDHSAGKAVPTSTRPASPKASTASAEASVAGRSTAAASSKASSAGAGAPLTASAPAASVPASPAHAVAKLAQVPAELPSTVLLRRPDVQVAEHQLRAMNANMGAARASLFPRISLTAALGTASRSLSSLFDGGNGTWSFVPGISLPIFTGGALQAGVDMAETDQKLAVNAYERVLQTAFKEVADALAERQSWQARLAASQALVDANQRTLDLSNARFKAGTDNFLSVLDAQRSLYTVQQQHISLQLGEQLNRVALYKALGGDAAFPT